jgi:hypothetical protein
MPHIDVKLHYSPNPDPAGKPLFAPVTNPIFIQTGQTISFAKSDDSVPGRILITFRHPELFSAPSADGTGHVTVVGTPIRTTYHCQLIGPDGHAIAESHEQGGDMLPENPPIA